MPPFDDQTTLAVLLDWYGPALAEWWWRLTAAGAFLALAVGALVNLALGRFAESALPSVAPVAAPAEVTQEIRTRRRRPLRTGTVHPAPLPSSDRTVDISALTGGGR